MMILLLRTIKMGTCDEVHFTCKLSVKGKKAKWYIKNQVKYRKRRNTLFCQKSYSMNRKVSDNTRIYRPSPFDLGISKS